MTDSSRRPGRIPVFNAETGEIRYVLKIRIQGNGMYFPLFKPEGLKEVHMPISTYGVSGHHPVTVVMADRELITILDALDPLPSWMHRIP